MTPAEIKRKRKQTEESPSLMPAAAGTLAGSYRRAPIPDADLNLNGDAGPAECSKSDGTFEDQFEKKLRKETKH
jgi:hypothetical protein